MPNFCASDGCIAINPRRGEKELEKPMVATKACSKILMTMNTGEGLWLDDATGQIRVTFYSMFYTQTVPELRTARSRVRCWVDWMGMNPLVRKSKTRIARSRKDQVVRGPKSNRFHDPERVEIGRVAAGAWVIVTPLKVITVLLLCLAPGIAWADQITGKIATVNEFQRTVALNNGLTFQVMDGVTISGLSPGQYVRIEFQTRNGHLIATEVSALDGDA